MAIDSADIETQSPSVLCSKLSSEITDGLYDLTSNMKAIRRLLVKTGATGGGSSELEGRMTSITDETVAKFKSTGHLVKLLDSLDSKSLDATQRFSQEKLSHEFKSMMYEFKNIQKEAANRELQRLKSAENKAAIEQDQIATEQTPLIQQQQQQQQSQLLGLANQQEVEFNNSIILDRENEIHQIQQGITEINSIFRDLGTLVTEQGSHVDLIEENISTLAENTQHASQQLSKANDYQKKRRKWSCYCLTFLIIILLVVVLVIIS